MLTPAELRTLDAALDRIVPGHGADGSTREFVQARVALQPDIYRAGLILLQAHGFDERSPIERDRTLGELQEHPSIALLVRHAVEGYYTSAAGMAAVGFRVTL